MVEGVHRDLAARRFITPGQQCRSGFGVTGADDGELWPRGRVVSRLPGWGGRKPFSLAARAATALQLGSLRDGHGKFGFIGHPIVRVLAPRALGQEIYPERDSGWCYAFPSTRHG